MVSVDSHGCFPLLHEMVGSSHLPPSLLNISFSKYLDINSPNACKKVRVSVGICLRSCTRSCCLFPERGSSGVFDQCRPSSPLVWSPWLLHHPTAVPILPREGKEQDPGARALKPAAHQREHESFWDLSSPQSQLRNFLRRLRLRLGGLEHLAYVEICQSM